MATADEGFGSNFSADSETSGTITDHTKTVYLTLLGGLVVGVLAAWLLVPSPDWSSASPLRWVESRESRSSSSRSS